MIPAVLEIDGRLQNKYFTLREAFRAFDTDKMGEITESKFIEGVIQMHTQINEDQIREVFRAIDINADGKITFDEFCLLS
jgi:Ca2+-binding EF-hand superfamily protein